MKIMFLLIGFFYFMPFFTSAQPDQSEFLKMAIAWIDGNIQCEELEPSLSWDPMKDKPPLGECHQVSQPIFCHLKSPNSTELILAVAGSRSPSVGGASDVDEKYIRFALNNGQISADVFYKNKGGAVYLFQIPGKPDLIRIEDRPGYCKTDKAYLFAEMAGKMTNVFTYEYISQCDTSTEGFNALLIPGDYQDIRLLRKETIGSLNVSDMKFYESIYQFDPISGLYKILKKENELPFIQGGFDWRSHLKNSGENDSDKDFEEIIRGNANYLEEVIGFMKINKNEPRRQRAHEILKDIAGQDLGEDYTAWEKWKSNLKHETLVE